MESVPNNHEPCSIVALYALGAVSEEEKTAFEVHLTGCRSCQGELARHEPAIEALLVAIPPDSPHPSTREHLIQRIAEAAPCAPKSSPLRGSVAQSAARFQPSQALWIQRAAEAAWEKSAMEGVSVRVLFSDPTHNCFTALVRMAPGTSYPSHCHGGPEECLVLEGDLQVGEEILGPGDYQRAPEGSRHDLQSTREGCLLYITSSLTDVFE